MNNIKLQRIEIENFKSINSKISIDIDEYDKSYTKVLIGLNEAGKSNILEAISLFNKSECSHYNFSSNHNRNSKNENISIDFFMIIENLSFCMENLSKNIPEELLQKIKNVSLIKQVWITNENKIKNYYKLDDFDITSNFELYLLSNTKYNIIKKSDINNDPEFMNYEELNKENLKKFIEQIFNDVEIIDFTNYEPLVSIWKSEDKYLINSPINLNNFANDPNNTSPPLKNIFYL